MISSSVDARPDQFAKQLLHPVDRPEQIHRRRPRPRQPRANPLKLRRKLLRRRRFRLQSPQRHAIRRRNPNRRRTAHHHGHNHVRHLFISRGKHIALFERKLRLINKADAFRRPGKVGIMHFQCKLRPFARSPATPPLDAPTPQCVNLFPTHATPVFLQGKQGTMATRSTSPGTPPRPTTPAPSLPSPSSSASSASSPASTTPWSPSLKRPSSSPTARPCWPPPPGSWLTWSSPCPPPSSSSLVGYKRTMVISLFIMVVGALLFVPAANFVSFPLTLAAIFMLPRGVCALQTSANPYVSILGPSTAPLRASPSPRPSTPSARASLPGSPPTSSSPTAASSPRPRPGQRA